MNRIIEFCFPFLVPMGLFVLSALVDSVMTEGQQLARGQLEGNIWNRIRKICIHFSKYMHHFYLACFGFGLLAISTIAIDGDKGLLGLETISYSGAPLRNTIFFAVSLIMLSTIAYWHTLFTTDLHRRDKVRAPYLLTFIHLLYAPLLLALAIIVRI